MAELTLDHMRESWQTYVEDQDKYNNIGLLNLTAYMGERTGFLLKFIDDLLALVEAVEWVPDGDDYVCPWCDGVRIGNEDAHFDDCPRQRALARAQGREATEGGG